MPIYGRHFEPGQLQFITTSTYRRRRLFTCQRFCWIFVQTLRRLQCRRLGFLGCYLGEKLGVSAQDIEQRQGQCQQGATAFCTHGVGSSLGSLVVGILPCLTGGFVHPFVHCHV